MKKKKKKSNWCLSHFGIKCFALVTIINAYKNRCLYYPFLPNATSPQQIAIQPNLCRVTFCKMSICLICLPFTEACAKQLTVNTDGPNCCRNWGEHLYGRALMYPIAIILLYHMETILRLCMKWKANANAWCREIACECSQKMWRLIGVFIATFIFTAHS